MKIVNNILLVLVLIVILTMWDNQYEFKYEKDWTDFIYKYSIILTIVMIALNNLMPTYKKNR